MDTNIFHMIVEDRCTKIKLVLASKAKEYAREDRLHNFKRAAGIANCTPTHSLFGMMNKHLVSVIDIFEDVDKGILPSEALLDEKFGDLINYLILGEACIREGIAGNAIPQASMVLQDVVLPVRLAEDNVKVVLDGKNYRDNPPAKA